MQSVSLKESSVQNVQVEDVINKISIWQHFMLIQLTLSLAKLVINWFLLKIDNKYALVELRTEFNSQVKIGFTSFDLSKCASAIVRFHLFQQKRGIKFLVFQWFLCNIWLISFNHFFMRNVSVKRCKPQNTVSFSFLQLIFLQEQLHNLIPTHGNLTKQNAYEKSFGPSFDRCVVMHHD